MTRSFQTVSLLLLTLFGVNGTLRAEIPDSRWTYPNQAYGKHPRQTLDVWLPSGETGTVAVVMFVHGGGWTGGSRRDDTALGLLDKCGWRRCAFVAVEYRFLADAEAEGIHPPVRAPMEDVNCAVRFVRAHAKEWHLDVNRFGLTGGSAGACASLVCAFSDDNALGIRTVAALWPQTSLDPQEMRAWIPNISYGARAFGYRNFEEWLANRNASLPWIMKYSPTALLEKCSSARAPRILTDPPVLPPIGSLPDDPTHAGMFRVKLRDLCARKGVSYAEVKSPEIYSRLIDSLSECVLRKP